MYTLKYFEEPQLDVMHELVQSYPLGALVMPTAQGLEANHVPFELAAEAGELGVLRGHLARANPAWQTVTEGAEVLVIFQGPHGYVSPSWYPSKKQGGKVVPTWNYAVVHAYGAIRVVHDKQWLLTQVSKLTEYQEGGRQEPWQIEDAPADFTAKLLNAIVGLEIQITRLQGKWKLSQNRPAEDSAGVADGLVGEATEAAVDLGRMMRARTPSG